MALIKKKPFSDFTRKNILWKSECVNSKKIVPIKNTFDIMIILFFFVKTL